MTISPRKQQILKFSITRLKTQKQSHAHRETQKAKLSFSVMSLMATNLTLFFFFLLLSPLATSSPTPITIITNPIEDDTKSAYDALADFNFPQGLLPKGALGYELDKSTGRFKAFLNGSCSFSLEGSYDLKYQSTISGYISQNKLTALTGVSVKILFLWLNIIEVGRDGDDIYFSVGIASASFPIDNFYECPQCGCGLNCSSQQVRKFRFNPFVSSS